jgi:ACS family phthalate transporter-like MFS transporter
MAVSSLQATPAAGKAEGSELDGIYRRITWRLMPFLFLCYLVNYIDRANIGYAKLQFVGDLGFSEAAYGLGAGLFYIGYVLFEVPSNLYLQRVGARATMMRIMVLWGVVSGMMALVRTPGQLYLARFLLGVAEAGFFPGIVLYLTYWYPAARRARVTSLLVMALIVAGMLGGLVSGWIMVGAHGVLGLKGWQALFIIEAVPAVLLGLLVYVVLDDKPEAARWLTDRDKALLRDDLDAQRPAQADKGKGHYLAAMKDPRVYLAALVYSAIGAGSAVISLWMPSMLKVVLGNDIRAVGEWSMLPYAAAGIAMVFVGRSSDRRRERHWHTAVPALLAALAFFVLGRMTPDPVTTLLLLCIAAAGIYGAISVFWTIPPAYLDGKGAAAGIALISSIGAGLGGFGGSALVGALKASTGGMQAGLDAVAMAVVVSIALLFLAMPARLLKKR